MADLAELSSEEAVARWRDTVDALFEACRASPTIWRLSVVARDARGALVDKTQTIERGPHPAVLFYRALMILGDAEGATITCIGDHVVRPDDGELFASLPAHEVATAVRSSAAWTVKQGGYRG